ncbi:MAG: oxidoreductase [Bacteroidales bacterium]|nr:oxidoreductase [Bacteroidales bacterium]
MKILKAPEFSDYELIDSGGFQKLERFGKYILIRPESQAVWSKSLTDKDWRNSADALYKLNKPDESGQVQKERGNWVKFNDNMPDKWFIEYNLGQKPLKIKLSLTSFGHIGIFPEQAENWMFIEKSIRETGKANPKILNLFAYTGIASLVAGSAGAQVTHLDAVKPVVTWARENMEASGLNDIRWIVEDAMVFVKREVTRGNSYDGLILDPPKYGRGPAGEKWLLDSMINELVMLCSKLLEPSKSFFVMNLYSMGFSSLIAENLIRLNFGMEKEPEFGELYITDQHKKRLPLGIFVRFTR